LDESWRAVAADFGLAHVNEEGGPAGEIPPSQAGTNGFRAPELDGKTVYTYKCDLYSVGKTMAALVLGYGYVDMTREMIIRNLNREHGVGHGFSIAPVCQIKRHFMTIDTTVLFEWLKNKVEMVAGRAGSNMGPA